MAYIINPDGTIKVVDVKYDSYGNVVLRDFSQLESTTTTSRKSHKTDHFLASRSKKKKKKKIEPSKDFLKDAMECITRIQTDEVKKDSVKKVVVLGEDETYSGTLFDSSVKDSLLKSRIDEFINKRKQQNRIITSNEYRTILKRLNVECKLYFIEEFSKYKAYCEQRGLYQLEEHLKTQGDFISMPRENSVKHRNLKENDNQKGKKKGKHKPSSSESYVTRNYGQSLADIATFSSLKKTTPESDYIQGRSVNGASRQPKYGYARDRYGRVQERDRLDEDRYNEFSQAQNHNKNYDYSDYDSNDDHDGAYSGWE